MDDIEKIIQKLKSLITDKRLKHSISVMYTSIKLAQHYNFNINKAKLAGLLHDCGKLKDREVGNIEHASLGSKLCVEQFGILDKDIINAINFHTVGREDMSMLEKIVFVADKIEPNRNYDGVELLRKLAYEDLDTCIVKILENTFRYLNSINVVPDEQSIITYKYLMNEIDNKINNN